MNKRKENLLKRIEKVQRIVEANYEPGNQSKCKLQAFRNHVQEVYPMSERTFWRYMNTDLKKKEKTEEDKNQLNLFDE